MMADVAERIAAIANQKNEDGTFRYGEDEADDAFALLFLLFLDEDTKQRSASGAACITRFFQRRNVGEDASLLLIAETVSDVLASGALVRGPFSELFAELGPFLRKLEQGALRDLDREQVARAAKSRKLLSGNDEPRAPMAGEKRPNNKDVLILERLSVRRRA